MSSPYETRRLARPAHRTLPRWRYPFATRTHPRVLIAAAPKNRRGLQRSGLPPLPGWRRATGDDQPYVHAIRLAGSLPGPPKSKNIDRCPPPPNRSIPSLRQDSRRLLVDDWLCPPHHLEVLGDGRLFQRRPAKRSSTTSLGASCEWRVKCSLDRTRSRMSGGSWARKKFSVWLEWAFSAWTLAST